MSIIAVKKYNDKIILGADSQRTIGGLKEETIKVFKVNEDFGFGHCGLSRNSMLFYYFIQTNSIKISNTIEDIYDFMVKFRDFLKEKTTDWKCESDFIIINKGKIFKYTFDSIFEINEYDAIGSGKDFAKAALYLDKSVYDAVKIACDLTIYCSEPITIYEFKTTI